MAGPERRLLAARGRCADRRRPGLGRRRGRGRCGPQAGAGPDPDPQRPGHRPAGRGRDHRDAQADGLCLGPAGAQQTARGPAGHRQQPRRRRRDAGGRGLPAPDRAAGRGFARPAAAVTGRGRGQGGDRAGVRSGQGISGPGDGRHHREEAEDPAPRPDAGRPPAEARLCQPDGILPAEIHPARGP